MKYLKSILLVFIIFMMTSCDYTMYVAMRNYREPAKVCVTYQKVGGSPFSDNDTLKLKNIKTPTFDSSLIRQNTSDSSYCFIAPKGKEVALRPISLGMPIQQIKIFNSPDSVLSVNVWGDRKEIKKLKKAGVIQTKGWLFTHSIIVENK